MVSWYLVFSLAMLLPWMAPAASPNRFRIDAPGAPRLEVKVDPGDRATVSSPWWRVSFDLRSGGVLDTVVFPHGSNRNVLLEPVRTYVDGWSDVHAPRTEVKSWEEDGAHILEFSGVLASTGRVPGPVAFRTRWTLTAFAIKVERTLRLSADLMASSVGIGSTRLREELSECGVRSGPATDPGANKAGNASYRKVGRIGVPVISERHAPVLLFFFARGVEGLDFTTASDWASWEYGLTNRSGVSRFEVVIPAGEQGLRVLREPLSVSQPVRIAKGEYTFSEYLGLPHIVERSNRKWRHMVTNNRPWATDEDIARWAESGVNIVRIHNDYSDDGNFWHDGAWPPYDEHGMAEMRRVIATCHRHGIRVIPYFSIKEFHPEVPGYKENVQDWKRSIGNLAIIHNTRGKGEYGAQMCLESGWRERFQRDVERAYRELGFDGIYYDWVANQICDNPRHSPRIHLDTDALMDILAWTRRLLAPKDGTLVLHLSGWFESLAMESYADLVVNFEEFSSKLEPLTMENIPIAGFQGETIPRSPCPYYRAEQPLDRNRGNIALEVVLGLFPHSSAGNAAARDTLNLFRAFKPYPLEKFRFHSVYTRAVTAFADDVYGAAYTSTEQSLVIVSNVSGNERKNIAWKVKPEFLVPSSQLVVTDVIEGTSRTVPATALADGSQTTALRGYQYRLFDIRPAKAASGAAKP
jgi:hypothetical protein